MDKMKQKSIKRSMTITFIFTICIIFVFSAIIIILSNQAQQEILNNRSVLIRNPSYSLTEIEQFMQSAGKVSELTLGYAEGC